MRRTELPESSPEEAGHQAAAPDTGTGGAAVFPRWWVWPLAAYLVLRLVDAAMIIVAGHNTGPGSASAGYLTTATNWDGQWYRQIAETGYPATLPRDPSGAVRENTWAFFPAYPMTVRLLMALTGLGFPVAAVLISLVGGAVATLLIYQLIAPVTDRLGARLLVIMLNTVICAPVFQIAYTEGMALALLAGTLLALQARRLGLTAVLVLALSLTRGVVLPLAPVFAIVAVVRWRHGARRREVIQTSILSAGALAATFLWPTIAGLVTGEPKAYLLTQESWDPGVGTLPVVRLIERVHSAGGSSLLGVSVALTFTVGVVLVLVAGQRQRLLRLWSGTYALYLLAAIDWKVTIIRYFLLAVPAVWAPVNASTGWPRRNRIWITAAVGAVGLATQWWWIRYSLTISPEFRQVP